MERLVCALYDDEASAAAAIKRLLESGVHNDVVSAVMHVGEIQHEDLSLAANPTGRRSAEGAMAGGALGAVLGAVLAGPAGVVIGGPLATIAAAGASGGLYGAIAGAITGRDDVHQLVRDLEQAVEAGRVLVTVDVEGRAQQGVVREVLSQMGGDSIVLT